MAEKEEIILILTGNKDNYPAWNYNHGPLYLDEDYYDGISRQEAIEKMAKAVGKLWEPVPLKPGDDYDYIWEHGIAEAVKSQWRKEAEAALNALLED